MSNNPTVTNPVFNYPPQEKGVIRYFSRNNHIPSTEALQYLFYFTHSGEFLTNSIYSFRRQDNNLTEPHMIIAVQKGCMHLETDGNEYSAHANEFLLFQGTKAHYYHSDNSTVFQFLVFGGNISDHYVDQFCKDKQHSFHPDNPQAIFAILSEIVHDANAPIPDEHMISGKIHLLLSAILKGNEKYNSLNSKRISDAIRFMHKEYNHDISLEDIAATSGLDPSYFSRLFRQYTNQSPYDYLLDYRLTQARLFLEAGNLQVKTISEICGFHSCQYFITVFKKRVGITPHVFKKLHNDN